MKTFQFVNKPSIKLGFTEEELCIFYECSKRHYDFSCKQAIKQGDILFSLKNSFDEEENLYTQLCSFNDVDRLCKIVECFGLIIEKQIDLYNYLFFTLTELNKEYERINNFEEVVK